MHPPIAGGIFGDIARDIPRSESDRASRLLLKAIRSLPEREQDAVLAYLVDRALVAEPERPARAGGSTLTMPSSIGGGLARAGMEMWASEPWRLWSASLILRRLADGVASSQLASELGLEADVLRATLRDLANRPHASDRLGRILEQLSKGNTITGAATELGLTDEEIKAELEPTEALARALCTALMARAALPSPPAVYLGTPSQGPLRTMPVRFPEPHYQRLKDWCEDHNFPMAVFVRGVVERFLDEQQRRTA